LLPSGNISGIESSQQAERRPGALLANEVIGVAAAGLRGADSLGARDHTQQRHQSARRNTLDNPKPISTSNAGSAQHTKVESEANNPAQAAMVSRSSDSPVPPAELSSTDFAAPKIRRP